MGKFLDIFKLKRSAPEPTIYGFSSGPKAPVDYVSKEDRSEQVTYAGIGQSTYGSGFPPSLYDNAITAVRSYPVVYAVITAISEAIAGLNVKVFQVQGGQEVEVTDHIFYQIFSNPNPYQGSFEFLEQLQQELDVTGNAFISLEKIGGGVEMYILNSKYVAIIPDPKIKVKAYRYYVNGQSVDYKPEEVIHIKYNDVDDPYFGMPPLSTATDIITFEKNRLKFINQFFKNGAIPSGVLETEQVLGETLLKKLRNEWTSIHGGVSNAHKVGIMQGGVTYRPISSPIKELDFPGLKKLSKDDILSIYKVPESILGSQEGTGAKEGKDAITAFWRQCIIPRLKRIESGMNRGLKMNIFGGGTFIFRFNLKDVAALQDDKTEMADYLQKMVASSIMTPNEARSVIGLPRVEGDEYADNLLVSNSFFGNQLMPVEEAANQGAGSNEEKPAAKPAKAGSKPPKEKPQEAAEAKPKEKPKK